MPRRRLLLALLLAGCAGEADEAPVELSGVFDPLARLADPLGPARPVPGRVELASTREDEPKEGDRNADWRRFERVGGRVPVLEADGPGFTDRLWITLTDLETFDMATADDVVLHVALDGEDLDLGRGRGAGVRLGDLGAGAVPGFPTPWVAGRGRASGAFQVLLPFAWRRSARMALEGRPGLQLYYQLDWRPLPEGIDVAPWPPGEGDPSRDPRLVEASRRWGRAADEGGAVDPTRDPERGGVLAEATAEVDGEADRVALRVPGPAVVRRLAVEAPQAVHARLRMRLVAGTVPIADAPVDLLFATVRPAGPFATALVGWDGGVAWLDVPFPVDDVLEVELRVEPGGALAPFPARVVVLGDEGPPAPDLGRLVVECTSTTVEGFGERPLSVPVLDTADGPGQVVSQHLAMRPGAWGFAMLEGDHEVWLDGAWRLLGTGTEDYFGGAYYFIEGPFTVPTGGAPGVHTDDPARPSVTMIRHHLVSPLSYARDLRFEWEVYAPETTYRSCVFRHVFDRF